VSPELGVLGRAEVEGVAVTEGRRVDTVEEVAKDALERLNGFFNGGSGGAESLFFPALTNAFLSEANEDFFVGAGVDPDSLGVDGTASGVRLNPPADMDESSEAAESVRAWK
jgi:hypothetical protein